MIGYCVGGTLLGTTLAYLAARGEEPFSSATFFAAQVDFTKAGDLMLFIDDAQLKALEEMMAERGYLDGARMATVFNMLRPKDLIWPYIVNNYMLGKKPFPFDLLFWNQDSTRLPAANHKFYLREFYHENKLARGQMTHRQRQARSGQGEAADLRAVRQGGPHRAGQVGVHRLAAVRRAGHLRARGLGAHRRRHQSARRQDQVPVLDQRPSARRRWRPGSRAPRSIRAPGGRTTPSGSPSTRATRCRPRTPGAKLGAIEDAPGSYVKAKS